MCATKCFLAIGLVFIGQLCLASEIEIIDRQVQAIDSVAKILTQNTEKYCMEEGKTELVLVIDSLPPPYCETFYYYLTRDSSGNVVKYEELQYYPDDALSFTYYFRPNGNIFKFEYYWGFFGSGCTKILRVRRNQYFSHGGQLVSETESLSDIDFNPIDSAGCGIGDYFEYQQFKTVNEVKEKLGL